MDLISRIRAVVIVQEVVLKAAVVVEVALIVTSKYAQFVHIYMDRSFYFITNGFPFTTTFTTFIP